MIEELRSSRHLQDITNADMPILDHTPMIRDEEGGDSDPFAVVLMFYCTRALDFPDAILTAGTPAHCEMSLTTHVLTHPFSLPHSFGSECGSNQVPLPS